MKISYILWKKSPSFEALSKTLDLFLRRWVIALTQWQSQFAMLEYEKEKLGTTISPSYAFVRNDITYLEQYYIPSVENDEQRNVVAFLCFWILIFPTQQKIEAGKARPIPMP